MSALRTASAVVTFGEEIIGESGPFETPESAAWNNTAPVCERLSALLGVPVVVLRLLEVSGGGFARGGRVRYHAEALERPRSRLSPAAAGDLFEPHPLRSRWATSAGLREGLEWASSVAEVTGPPRQAKTWNLGAVFRLPVEGGSVWLKGSAPFGAAEPDALEWIGDPSLTPVVLARRPGWTVLSHLPGEDCWEAGPGLLDALVRRWAEAAGRLGAPASLPDRRPARLPALFAGLLDGEAGRSLDAAETEAAGRLLDALPRLISGLEACGLPEGLVHGDFHPGNCRSDGTRTTVLDFADAHHGHPALDGLRPATFVAPDLWEPCRSAWISTWSRAVPGSDPARALELFRPLAHLSYAHRYQEFLDAIEPSERIYHEGDPAEEIREALQAVKTSRPPT
ncbi:aminoglycoside phosphotransferase family protein [Actinocorallia longicatena]|uniref:Aminoglycoside phosphotransferase domain-containing protein n=1 Tax=Actinocorallia longicatena TaxID=111803 RepID=A0ABP6Q818_9ACTN